MQIQELRTCPLNPRQVLYLGKPQDRTGSPILGDFEVPVPPKIGGRGGRDLFNCVSPEIKCTALLAQQQAIAMRQSILDFGLSPSSTTGLIKLWQKGMGENCGLGAIA